MSAWSSNALVTGWFRTSPAWEESDPLPLSIYDNLDFLSCHLYSCRLSVFLLLTFGRWWAIGILLLFS